MFANMRNAYGCSIVYNQIQGEHMFTFHTDITMSYFGNFWAFKAILIPIQYPLLRHYLYPSKHKNIESPISTN